MILEALNCASSPRANVLPYFAEGQLRRRSVFRDSRTSKKVVPTSARSCMVSSSCGCLEEKAVTYHSLPLPPFLKFSEEGLANTHI